MGKIKEATERVAGNAVGVWTSIKENWETAKKLFPYAVKYPDEATGLFGKTVGSALKSAAVVGGVTTFTNKCIDGVKLKKLIRALGWTTALLMLRKDFWKKAEEFVKKCEELDELYPDNEEDVDVDDDDEEEDDPEPEDKKKNNKKSGKKNDKDFEDVK